MLVNIGLPQVEAVFEPVICEGSKTEKPRRQGGIERMGSRRHVRVGGADLHAKMPASCSTISASCSATPVGVQVWSRSVVFIFSREKN